MMHTRHMGDDAVEVRTYMFVSVVSCFQDRPSKAYGPRRLCLAFKTAAHFLWTSWHMFVFVYARHGNLIYVSVVSCFQDRRCIGCVLAHVCVLLSRPCLDRPGNLFKRHRDGDRSLKI